MSSAPLPDAGLAAAAEAFLAAVAPDPVIEFPVTGLDRVGVPTWCNWWAGGASGAGFGGVGYGSSDLRARVGALGELVEHVCSRRALAALPRETGSLRGMRQRYGGRDVVDPRRLGLPAGSPYDDDRPLHWWPLRRWSDGSPVWAPAELVASSGADLVGDPPPGGWLTTAVSNGLGAGVSLDQAVAHGVLEVLQRDGNGLTFRALDTGRVIDLAGVTDPEALAALAQLAAAGVEVVAKLAATDFEMAGVDVVGMADGDDILSATACGEAVHPDREVALRKAVLEFAAARARKQLMHGPVEPVLRLAPPSYASVPASVDPAAEERRVLAAMLDWLALPEARWRPELAARVLHETSRVAFTDLPTAPVDAGSLLPDVVGRLAAEGFELLVADLSPPSPPAAWRRSGHARPEEQPVCAAKVLVPGLEVETVAYARIGERNAARLVGMGRDDLVRVGRRPSPSWARVHLTDDAVQRLGGPAWLDRAALDALPGMLFPLYREPGRHAAARARSAAGHA